MDRSDQTEDNTVWAAEHGASSGGVFSDDRVDGANAGHRFRIHGRLAQEEVPSEPGRTVAVDFEGPLETRALRAYVARHAEIDLQDVRFEVEGETVVLEGTVTDDGERRTLESLMRTLPAVKGLESRLRVTTAV